MSARSPSIEFDLHYHQPKKAESKVYIEIIWTRLRPYRVGGERVEAESMD